MLAWGCALVLVAAGVDVLWRLVNNENDRVSELADQLVTRYFGEAG